MVGEESFVPSHAFLSLSSPFYTRPAGPEKPLRFLTGTLLRWSKTVDFSDRIANFFLILSLIVVVICW